MTGQLYLKPDEGKFLSIAVVSMLEQLNDSASDVAINWSPESRKNLKDMLASGKTLRIKLERLGFDLSSLPPLVDGEEKDYFTKES